MNKSTPSQASGATGRVAGAAADGGRSAAQRTATGGAGGALGNTAKFASPIRQGLCLEGTQVRKVVRYVKQAAARELLPSFRVVHCIRTPFSYAVWLHQHIPTGQASFGGLQTCGSVWVCPICAAKVSEQRRQELAAAIEAWEAKGGRVVMATFTVRHHRGDDLAQLVEGIGQAYRRARSGKAWQLITQRHGIAGTIRALEVTHGRNGWHPHLHCLLFVVVSCDLGRLEADLRHTWEGGIRRAGLKQVNAHGVSVGFGQMTAADYVAKYGRDREETGWGVKEELTKANSKSGSGDSRTPFDLLGAYAFDQDEEAGRLFVVFAQVFFRKQQLVWSTGLRALLLATEEEATDEELAAAIGEDSPCLGGLTLRQWRVVLGNDMRAELLNELERGGLDGVRQLLVGLGTSGDLLAPPSADDTAFGPGFLTSDVA